MKRKYAGPEARERKRKREKEWRDANREKVREIVARSMRKRNYGITDDEYFGLLKKQNGRCAICQEPCSTGQRLSVDHCHTTGRIRGLLCRRHNAGLGNFSDDPALMRKAIKYLETQ